MWTDTTRALYPREHLALPSDLTDAEWAVLEPFFPPPSRVGRPRKWSMRRIVEACQSALKIDPLSARKIAPLCGLECDYRGSPWERPADAAGRGQERWQQHGREGSVGPP